MKSIYLPELARSLEAFPRWNVKVTPVLWGQKETKERGKLLHISGKFKKQKNLLTRLALGGCETSRPLHPSAEILKSLHRGLNWVLSCILSRRSQHHIAFTQACKFENGSHCGNRWAECTCQGQGRRGLRASDCPDAARGSAGGRVLSMTSSNIFFSCDRLLNFYTLPSFVICPERSASGLLGASFGGWLHWRQIP